MNHVAPQAIQFTEWISIGAIAMCVVQLLLYIFFMRRNRYFLPRTVLQWFLTTMLMLITLVTLAVGTLAFVTRTKLMAEIPYYQGFIGINAPEFPFASYPQAELRNIEQYRGKAVMVNLWATWCPPCRRELPILEQVQRQYAESGLVILALTDESAYEVDRFLAGKGSPLEIGFFDPNLLLKSPFQEASLSRPFTFFIDRQGRIRDFIIGAAEFELFDQKVRDILR